MFGAAYPPDTTGYFGLMFAGAFQVCAMMPRAAVPGAGATAQVSNNQA